MARLSITMVISLHFRAIFYFLFLLLFYPFFFWKGFITLCPPKRTRRIVYLMSRKQFCKHTPVSLICLNIILGYKMYLIQGSFWPRENSRGDFWLQAKSETVTLLVSIFDGIRLHGKEYFLLKLYFYVNVREINVRDISHCFSV